MAVGTMSAIAGGAGLLLGGAQAIGGAKRAREARNELNNYERQKLDNAFKDVPLFTEGIDLKRDENARVAGSLVDSASNAGSRTIIGAAPRISAATNQLNEEAASNLDGQNMRRAYAIAGDKVRIEGITEDRDNANINALSTQANAGRQDMWSGILGAASGLGALGRGATPSENPEVTAFDTSGARGLTPMPAMMPTATTTPYNTSPYFIPTPYSGY